jgi:hypothetical protein
VYLKKGEGGNPFFHHFRANFGDKAVENSPRRWIWCGQSVDNPLTALLERAKRIRAKEKNPRHGFLRK